MSATLPKGGEKSFNSGVVIPAKMRSCNKCNDNKICGGRCINQGNEKKQLEADYLNLLERLWSYASLLNFTGYVVSVFLE